MRINKWLISCALLFCIPAVFILTDRIVARISSKKLKSEQVQVEVGDLIFRTNSYILSSGKYYYKSGLPGHLAIVLTESAFSSTDQNLGNINVVESAMLNKYWRRFQAKVDKNKAFENFGNARGRRFVLKMHLSNEQKKKLIELTNSQIGRPYSIFATKDNQSKFNCATFARWAILEIDGFDLDSDGGQIVFPNDILKNPRFDKPCNRILL